MAWFRCRTPRLANRCCALRTEQRPVLFTFLLGFVLVHQKIEWVSSASMHISADIKNSSLGDMACRGRCRPGTERASGCACVLCRDGSFSSGYEETCSPCDDCPIHVVVAAKCNSSSNINCTYGKCEAGYNWNDISKTCNQDLTETAGSSPITETSQFKTSSSETGTTVAASTLETGSTVAKGTRGTTPESDGRSNVDQHYTHFANDDQDNRKTLVVAAVAAAGSLLVVVLSVAAILLKCRTQTHQQRRRPIPDKIKTVGDLPDSMIKWVGRELANSSNPAYYRQLLCALDVSQSQIRALDSILRHGSIDEFSHELFSALNQLEQPVTVSQLCDAVKELGADTLALEILRHAKDLNLKLDEYEDLAQAVEDCEQKILAEPRADSRSPDPVSILPDYLTPAIPGMNEEIRHQLISTTDEC